MAKRGRRRYTWFPVVGSGASPGGTPNDNFNQRVFAQEVAPNGDSAVDISPVVPDVPMKGDDINVDAPGQLVQAIGQEYVIERLVGKIIVDVQAPADDGIVTVFPKSILVGCGFFVARAADADSGGGPNLPVGAASLAERQENFSPLSEDSIREPWMWRRIWVLNTHRQPPNNTLTATPFGGPVRNAVAGTGLAVTGGAPTTNIMCGSALDGPHFDVKSVRRVGNDERLWFVVASRTLDNILGAAPFPNAITPSGVRGLLDIRVLGQLRKAHNRSNF